MVLCTHLVICTLPVILQRSLDKLLAHLNTSEAMRRQLCLQSCEDTDGIGGFRKDHLFAYFEASSVIEGEKISFVHIVCWGSEASKGSLDADEQPQKVRNLKSNIMKQDGEIAERILKWLKAQTS